MKTSSIYLIIWITGIAIIIGGIYGASQLTVLPPAGGYVITDDLKSCIWGMGAADIQENQNIMFKSSSGSTSFIEGDGITIIYPFSIALTGLRELYFIDGQIYAPTAWASPKEALCSWKCGGGLVLSRTCMNSCITTPSCLDNYNIQIYGGAGSVPQLPAGRHFIEFMSNSVEYIIYKQDYIDVASQPCAYSAGQMLVMDRFTAGDTISPSTTTYLPVGYCSEHSPLILDENTMRSYIDCQSSDVTLCNNILTKLKNNQPYVVPTGKQVGLYYIADKPLNVVAVCQLGETYVAKEGLCLNTLLLTTPCYNGIIDTQGTCYSQANVNYVCPGQLEIQPDGSQICNIYVPTRTQYQCVVNGETITTTDPADCNILLDSKYYCDGVEITDPTKCTTSLTTKYYCNAQEVPYNYNCANILSSTIECQFADGTKKLVANASECTASLDMTYTCPSTNTTVTDPNKCPTNVILKYKCYNNNGDLVKEVLKPEDCVENTVIHNYFTYGGSGSTSQTSPAPQGSSITTITTSTGTQEPGYTPNVKPIKKSNPFILGGIIAVIFSLLLGAFYYAKEIKRWF